MAILEFDFASLFSWANLFAILLGTFAGMLIGALPGLGATLAIVLLLPITYSMEPLASILMLLAAYQAAEYGGSISAIILGIPGTPAAAATVLDGRPLAKNHSPGKALGYSLHASTVGGIFGGLVLIFLSVPLVQLALVMGDSEYFLIGVLGLVAVAGLSSKDLTKSFISVVLGLMFATTGTDLLSGALRFTVGRVELHEGISIIALLVGTFAFAELFRMISVDLYKKFATEKSGLSTTLTLKEFTSVGKPTLIGSVLGSIIGIFPGMGAGTSAWFSYSAAKRYSKNTIPFGTGNPEGIAAPEAANNATVGGALVPLLSLGIPGSPAMAVIMGAFIIHGIQPGPRLFTGDVNLVYGIFIGFLFTTIAMFLLGKIITTGFTRVLTVPNGILVPTVLLCSFIGIYAARRMEFDLWFALAIGVFAFIFVKLDFSIPSFILAFVLSPIIEQSFRRALILSDGSYTVFVTRPGSILILILIILILITSFIKVSRERKKRLAEAANNES